jgi:hypothetical protein
MNIDLLPDSTDLRVLVAAAVLIGMLCGVLGVFAWRWYRGHRERRLRAARISGVSVDLVRDVLVPDGGGGTLHLDYLLLTPQGLIILDLRDITGNVFGSDAMTEWTVMDEARRFTFANPQNGLYDRIAAVKAIVGDAGAQVPVEGRVVFTCRASFPKGLPRWTLSEETLEADLALGDRGQGERLVEPMRGVWGRVRSTLQPSNFSGAG